MTDSASKVIAVRPRQAARLLNVSPRTLRKWMRSGLVHYFQERRIRLIPVAELERLVDGRQRVSTRET